VFLSLFQQGKDLKYYSNIDLIAWEIEFLSLFQQGKDLKWIEDDATARLLNLLFLSLFQQGKDFKHYKLNRL